VTVAFADLVISILRLLHAMTIGRCMNNLRLQGKRAAKLLTSAGWPAGGPAPEALRKGSQVRLTLPAAGVRFAIGIESPARAPLRKRGQGPCLEPALASAYPSALASSVPSRFGALTTCAQSEHWTA
jgi:hypothetical protein